MSQLQDVANEFRSRLLANETQAATRMIGAYSKVLLTIEPQVARLMGRIEDLKAKGETVGPGMAYRAGRLDSILQQTRGEFARFSVIATREVTGAQQVAVNQSFGDTLALTLAALGPAPEVAQDVLRSQWDRLPVGAVEEFVGRTSAGSPLKELFDTFGPRVATGLETSITSGLAAGYNPRQIAREVRQEFGMGLNRALLISRTETITAYREASRRTYQEQPEVVEGWIWHSALGPRTCAACWAMHGTKHSNEERLDGHPSCRCTMIPDTGSWESLGFTGLPDTRPQVPKGVDLFEQASPATQAAVLGSKGFAAYQAGEVKLVDFLARTDDERWGTTRYARSLLAVRQGRGGFQVGAAAL